MRTKQPLLPRIGISETLFSNCYEVKLTATEGATFKYSQDAYAYIFRYHTHLVWHRIESYNNSLKHLVKTHKIITHEAIAAAKELDKVSIEMQCRSIDLN